MNYFIFIFLLFSLNAFSKNSSQLKFEPIYGIETSLIRYPEPSKYVTRATYGLRAIYGTRLLSSELEVSQAKSQENYTSPSQKVEDTSDRLSLGLRSSISLASLISAYIRAGGRASQGKTILTTDTSKETIDNPLRVDPYAGAGIQLSFAPNMGINAGVTLVRNEENKYDTQYTLGLNARIGK